MVLGVVSVQHCKGGKHGVEGDREGAGLWRHLLQSLAQASADPSIEVRRVRHVGGKGRGGGYV